MTDILGLYSTVTNGIAIVELLQLMRADRAQVYPELLEQCCASVSDDVFGVRDAVLVVNVFARLRHPRLTVSL